MSMKSYLRYEPAESFGVITSPQCNIVYDTTGNLAIAGANSRVNVVNMRTHTTVGSIEAENQNYPYVLPGEVSVLCVSSDRQTVAAGYSTGEVRLLNYLKFNVMGTFRGHRTRVHSLCYNSKGKGGTTLASGGGDCDIICWDTVAMTASCKLRGHKGPVNGLAFVDEPSSSSREYLVSGSTDTLLKVWDLVTQTCVQTLVGHRSEIWSLSTTTLDLAVFPLANTDGDEDGDGTATKQTDTSAGAGGATKDIATATGSSLLLTGSADELVRGYLVCWDSVDNSDSASLLRYVGGVKRAGGGADKCTSLSSAASGLLVAQSSGKYLDLFRVRSGEECRYKYRRRCKKERQRAAKEALVSQGGGQEKKARDRADDVGVGSKSVWEEDAAAVWNADADATDTTTTGAGTGPSKEEAVGMRLGDVLEGHSSLRCAAKTRSAVFSPAKAVSGGGASGLRSTGKSDTLLVGLINNSVETYAVPVSAAGGGAGAEALAPQKLAALDHAGHRSDVRAVAVSRDGRTIATCSQEGVKIWSATSYQCLRGTKCGYALCAAFAPGDQFLLVGTKDGAIEVIDSITAESVDSYDAHTAEVWSLCMSPSEVGMMTCSGDGFVKFWEFSVSAEDGGADRASSNADGSLVDVVTGSRKNILVLRQSRVLQMSHDALVCCYSPVKDPTKTLLAVGLLDNTIKVFFDDSLKFFLSLYGHTLPVTAVDISTDGTLLVSGSADKTIKIWGLDFGDCHRSLLGHGDSITCVRFQPQTHYFFSSDKAGSMKYWDADRFEQILDLPGHRSCLWDISITRDGGRILTAGQDRTIRVWQRTEDMVFVEEEKERYMESQVEASIAKEAGLADAEGGGPSATLRSLESVKGGERLMECMDIVEAELKVLEGIAKRTEGVAKGDTHAAAAARRVANPVLLGMSPYKFLVHTLRQIKAPDMEQALLVLPFHYVNRLLAMLLQLAQRSLDLEQCARITVFLLRCHYAQISVTAELVPVLLDLKALLVTRLSEYRGLIGCNVAGLKIMHREVKEDASAYFVDFSEPVPGGPGGHVAASGGGGNSSKGNKKRKHKD